MKLAIALLLTGALLTGAAGSAIAADWKEYNYPVDNFTVKFSGPMTVQDTGLEEQAKARTDHSTTYFEDRGNAAFIVMATLYHDGQNPFGETAVTSSYKAKCAPETVTVTPISPLKNRASAFHVEGQKCLDGAHMLAGDYIGDGNWFYQVYYMIPMDDAVAKADADTFIGSFDLLK